MSGTPSATDRLEAVTQEIRQSKTSGQKSPLSFDYQSITRLSLVDFQELNHTIYGVQNDLCYSTQAMLSRIHRYSTRILKMARKGTFTDLKYCLCMSFSWSLGVANRFHITIDDELWKRFPGVCPYCSQDICACGQERAAERLQVSPGVVSRPGTLRGYQTMLRSIYPRNIFAGSAMHLAEEVGELDEAVGYYIGTHRPEFLEEIHLELVDLISNILAVASCMGVDLASEMAEIYQKGCPNCGNIPCNEGYVTTTSPAIR